MKKLLLILFISSNIFAQVTGSTETGKIIFSDKKPIVKDLIAPSIQLITPIITAGDTLVIRNEDVLVKIKVTDGSGVQSFKINSKVVSEESPSVYSQRIIAKELIKGINVFTLSAIDKNNNASELKLAIKYQPVTAAPEISIIEPLLNANNDLTVSENSIAIIIKVKTEVGLKSVLINNNIAEGLSDNQYFLNISLKDGKNLVAVKAVDENNLFSEKKFLINKSSDDIGPVIKILEPYASRGVNIILKNDVIKIKGVALDESGIKDVTVNNRKAELIPTGEFSIDNFLDVGNNKIIVKAIDNKFNITVDTFTITRKAEEIISKGKYLALIIGIDKYKGVWNELRNAVNDAKAIEELLKAEYNFDEIYSLYNESATRKNIIEKFESLSSSISKDDNVLIFYSGHGEFKQQLNKGYWVPVDAATKSTADYISNSDIQTFLNGIPSKHTLLVSDACFSGDIFRGRTEETPFEDSEKYFKEVYRKVSRAALTAGDIEPVTDGGKEGHSVFAYYLLKTLRENTSKYFTAGQLYNQINIPIINNSEQTPVYMPIKNTGDEGGQFVFIKK